MTITVSRGEFLSKLRLVGKNILPNKSNAELESFLFELRENELFVSGTNDQSSITTSIECNIEQQEKDEAIFTVNAKTLLDALKEIPEQPLILQLDFAPEYVSIVSKYSNGKFELVGGKGISFPTIPPPAENAIKINISSLDLLFGLKYTYFRCADDELRPVMNGVYFDQNENGLTFVASDGNTLAMKEYKFDSGCRCAFILPDKLAKVLVDIIPSDDYSMSVVVDNMRVVLKHSDFTINCRHIDGKFPNYRSVIPAGNDKICKVAKSDITAALKRVSVFCNKNTQLIKLSLTDNNLTIAAQDLDYSTSADESLNVDYSGQKLDIGFKSTFLLDILSTIPSSEVVFHFSDPSRAALVKGTESTSELEDLTYLIMPMMIN